MAFLTKYVPLALVRLGQLTVETDVDFVHLHFVGSHERSILTTMYTILFFLILMVFCFNIFWWCDLRIFSRSCSAPAVSVICIWFSSSCLLCDVCCIIADSGVGISHAAVMIS